MTRAFSHLSLVWSVFLSPMGPDPQSRMQWELLVPFLGPECDHYYQAAVNWWEKEALFSQPNSFPLGPALNVSCRVLEEGTLSQAGEFASASILLKVATLSGLQAPSLDARKSDFAVVRGLADLLLVQSLLLFLKDCVGKFKPTLPQHDLRGAWSSMCQLLTGAAMAIQP